MYKYIVVTSIYVIKSGVYKTELGKKVPKIIKEIDLVVDQHTRQTTTHKYLTTNLCFVPVPFVVYYALCFGSCSSYHYMFSSSPSGKKSLKKKAVLLVELAWGSSTNQERSK